MSSQYAPITLFVYKRLWHTEQTINSLLQNAESKDSDLLIYSDGPKGDSDTPHVEEVRSFLHSLKGFKSISIVKRPENYGLAKSIIQGVKEVLNNYGRVIVLEDDMIVSKYFLSYMNQALSLYKDELSVACIHAWNYPLGDKVPQTFFLRGADCWGWGTWKRAWDIFEEDGKKLYMTIKEEKLEWEFDRNGAYPYTQMLEDQIEGKNNSWAIRWHASAFLADMYCLHPGRSLVQNIGLDGSGTHSGIDTVNKTIINNHKIILSRISITQNNEMIKKIYNYINKNQSFIKRILNIFYKVNFKINSIIKKILNKNKNSEHIWFKGNYDTWEDALKDSTGYDSPLILNKVKDSLLKVRNGEAVYERDSVLFNEIQYNLPLLTFLLYISASEKGNLNVIDFGGSLGSSFYQNKNFLKNISVKWSIVEQENFVKEGRNNFKNNSLDFFYTIDEILSKTLPSTILLSSVLPYLEKPYELLDKILKHKFKYVIIDRTPFFFDDPQKDIITIENVHPSIYTGSYPAYFFNYQKFIDKLSTQYNLMQRFPGNDILSLGWIKTEYLALLFELK